jgi:hypothetical protein
MNEENLIDDTFFVKQQKWGTWNSYDKEGKGLVTSLTEDQCISATRFLLQFRQENKFESQNNKENMSKYSGSIDYKL